MLWLLLIICTEQIRIDIDTPAWLAEYPNAEAIVEDVILDARRDYLIELSYFDPCHTERERVFSVWTDETRFSETVVSLTLIFYEDVGGLYPLDSITTLTFDLEADAPLTLEDILRGDPVDVLAPFVEDHPLADAETFEHFTLSDEALALVYPPERMGPFHAAMNSVVIPLAEIDLVPAFRRAIMEGDNQR
jgi:hypothetical protein